MIWPAKYFSLTELTHSDIAVRRSISNVPSAAIAARLADTAVHMDFVRTILSYPIIVSSGYRGPDLNKVVGGADTSAHTLGYAVDFTCPGYGIPLHVAEKIRDSGVKFDQLIYEGAWVHISFDPRIRQQCLTARFRPGKPVMYENGLHA
ncbi:peptidase M15A [Asticcacaulis sp. AC466]|uniref:D-Ala-D-Ala carboxypeptidase family metallohydrolase n=1 Tax=Asticcacaulis sp. AC466 TaxID=1282362 RepID=UPI0003C412CC|nr:D-Ala-D-Ala carboxypeptidase family metallohydrolase [Asticcacaulis sp. AC466]ESQ82339.1 peptidase M15A [Asticcacaulis sp. AC466]